MHKVTLSNNKEFICSSDQTILEAAIQNGIALEHSCRNGRCGICICELLDGETNLVSSEDYIIEKNKIDNSILTCSRSPKTDLVLDIEDLGDIGLIKSLTLPCRINSIEFLSDDICILQIRIPPNSNFDFVSGQYIELIKGAFKRSYSIANTRRDDELIELHIKKVEGGLMSNYIFNEAKINDLLRFEGPFGTFSYRANESKYIIFIATGTGIAPIKSILESFKKNSLTGKKVIVIWGGRMKKDLYYDLDEIDIDFNFIPVLSRENLSGFKSGYVHNVLLEQNIDLENATVYACGSSQMIDDAHKILVQSGLSKKRFYSDAFVSSN
jgi:CDP-4-dehydro-6-deoxyglucose reductase